MSDETNNTAALTTGPVGRTLLKMALPMLGGFVSMIIFNAIDTFFVSELGTDPLTAIGFTVPVIMVVFSVAFGMGMGAAAVVSRAIGEGDQDRVRRLTTHGLILAVVSVGFFCFLGLRYLEPIFRLINADERLIPLIAEYMRIWLVGMVFVVVPIVGNSVIRATGDTVLPAVIMLVGASVNVLLDWLLIFGHWGFPRMELAGAALATVIARAVTLVFSVVILHYRYRLLEWAIPGLRSLLRSWGKILSIGLSACATNVTVTILFGTLTWLAATISGQTVAAINVGRLAVHFPDMVVMAVAASLVPFVGQNLGQGRFDRIRAGLRRTQIFALIWGGASYAVLALAAWPLARIFSSDETVLGPTVQFLRIVPIGMAVIGPAILTGSMLNGLHKPLWSSALRIIHVSAMVTLAVVGRVQGGYVGMLGGIVVADVIVASVGVAMGWRIIRREEREFVPKEQAEPPLPLLPPEEPEATASWD